MKHRPGFVCAAAGAGFVAGAALSTVGGGGSHDGLGIVQGLVGAVIIGANAAFLMAIVAATATRPTRGSDGSGQLARNVVTAFGVAVIVFVAPMAPIVGVAVVVNWPRYQVESSSVSPDGRFRVDNETASTFQASYRRVRIVRIGAERDDRFFCEGAGGDVVGTFVANDALLITSPQHTGDAPTPGVFSQLVRFDPDDLGNDDAVLLSGTGGC